MASRNLSLLVPEMQDIAKEVLDRMDDRILIYCTVRSAEEQAKLWRQSRSTDTIKKKIRSFENNNRMELAQILRDVGPQYGPHVTYVCCGESYHQYGLAFDAVPMRCGKPIWGTKDKQWQEYGNILLDLKVVWGGNWIRFKDYPHAQLFDRGNAINLGLPLVRV